MVFFRWINGVFLSDGAWKIRLFVTIRKQPLPETDLGTKNLLNVYEKHRKHLDPKVTLKDAEN